MLEATDSDLRLQCDVLDSRRISFVLFGGGCNPTGAPELSTCARRTEPTRNTQSCREGTWRSCQIFGSSKPHMPGKPMILVPAVRFWNTYDSFLASKQGSVSSTGRQLSSRELSNFDFVVARPT